MDYKQAQIYFIQQGLVNFCEPIELQSPKAQLTLNFNEEKSLDILKVSPPQNASLILRFSAFKKQSIAFASVAATLVTDSSLRLIFHQNIYKNLKKQPNHVDGSEITLQFSSSQECRQIALTLNFLLRSHRRINKTLYEGPFAANVYVNKLTSTDLTTQAIKSSLVQLNSLNVDGENQASEIAAFLDQFVEYLTEDQLRQRQEETFEDLLSQAEIVQAEDDMFKLGTHGRYPLFNYSTLASYLKETLFDGVVCDIPQANQILTFIQTYASYIIVSPMNLQNLQQIQETLKNVSQMASAKSLGGMSMSQKETCEMMLSGFLDVNDADKADDELQALKEEVALEAELEQLQQEDDKGADADCT